MVDRKASSNYSFLLNWRSRLSGVQATAANLATFRLGPHNFLSFRLEILNATAAGGALRLAPKGQDAGIVIMTFSIIVITQDSFDLELVTFSDTPAVSVSNFSYFANSSKFQPGSAAPHSIHAFQWVTGSQKSANFVNYWCYPNLTVADSSLLGYYLKLSV
jgi:hypothetical protein